LPGGCAADSKPPDVEIVSPDDNDDVGALVQIVVEASDPGPVANGIREVILSAEEQGGSRTAAIARLPGPGPAFQATWTVPPCEGPGDRWYLDAEAVDGCDRTAGARVMVRRRSANCQPSAALAPGGDPSVPPSGGDGPALVWTSELAVAGGRGQVITNGGDVLFPGPGRSELTLPVRAGRNSLEAVLVEGEGPGTWRFTLASGAIRPGSLRVVAGEAVAAGPETVAFRLHGRPGERAVFAFEATR
jgi:hypothetical protein